MGKSFAPETEEKMKKTVDALQKDLAKVRTGRASPALLDNIRVESYGTMQPLRQIAAVAVPDPKTITISPWDKNLMSAIEKAIQTSDLGLNPIKDRQLIRLPIPALTEERRRDVVKQCSKTCEEAKVALRNVRRDINEAIKKAEKNKELTEDESKKEQDNVQKSTDKYAKQIDEIFKAKEKEVMAI